MTLAKFLPNMASVSLPVRLETWSVQNECPSFSRLGGSIRWQRGTEWTRIDQGCMPENVSSLIS